MKDQTFFDFWQEFHPHKKEEQSFSLWDYDVQTPISPELPMATIPEDSYVRRLVKVDNEESRVRLSKDEIKDESVSKRVIEYENWEGRIVNLDSDAIGAHIVNTLNQHSKRFVRIEKSYFISKGITEELSYGDRFELSYQTFRYGKGPIRHDDFIRMIHHVEKTKEEIDAYVDEQIRALDFLFE